jgi:hypothetical protein
MGQRNHVEGPAIATLRKGSADHFVEFFERQELRNGQFADWNDEARSQQFDFVVHPGRTIPNFVGSRNTISPRGRFPREAAADGGKINPGAHFCFAQIAKLLEPTEEGAARRPGKRFAEDRFPGARRLTDQHDFAQDRPAGNRRREHARTAPALEQLRDVFV